MSLDHQEEDLELKSPVIRDINGLRLFMSFKKFSKLEMSQIHQIHQALRMVNNRYNHFFVIVIQLC